MLYLLPLAYLPLVAVVARHLPESRRFAAPHVEAPVAGHGRRFWLLAVTGLLLAFFATPASQLGNEFLREAPRLLRLRRHPVHARSPRRPPPSASSPAATSPTCGAGGWSGAVGIIGGTVLTVAGVRVRRRRALAVHPDRQHPRRRSPCPALGVYRPELFPTSLRGRAAGCSSAMALLGAAAGLLFVGRARRRRQLLRRRPSRWRPSVP